MATITEESLDETLNKTQALVSEVLESEAALAEKKRLAEERAQKIKEKELQLEARRRAREERRKAREEERRRRQLGLPPLSSETQKGPTKEEIDQATADVTPAATEPEKPAQGGNKATDPGNPGQTRTNGKSLEPAITVENTSIDEINRLMAETEDLCVASEKEKTKGGGAEAESSAPPLAQGKETSEEAPPETTSSVQNREEDCAADDTPEDPSPGTKENSGTPTASNGQRGASQEHSSSKTPDDHAESPSPSPEKEEQEEQRAIAGGSSTQEKEEEKEPVDNAGSSQQDALKKELLGPEADRRVDADPAEKQEERSSDPEGAHPRPNVAEHLKAMSRFSLPQKVNKDEWKKALGSAGLSADDNPTGDKSSQSPQPKSSKEKDSGMEGTKSMVATKSKVRKQIVPLRRKTMLDPTLRSGNTDPLQQEQYYCYYKNGDVEFEIQCPNTYNAHSIKEAIAYKASQLGAEGLKPADYVLLIPGANYYITNETIAVHRHKIMQVCKKSFVYPRLCMVLRPDTLDTEPEELWNRKIHAELTMNRQITELTGTQLKDVLASDSEESKSFRKRVATVRNEVLKQLEAARKGKTNKVGKYDTSYLPQYRESEPMPPSVPSKIEFLCTLPNPTQMTKIVSCEGHMTVEEVKNMVFKKLRIVMPSAKDKTPDHYLLKVTGYKEYFIGEYPVISYDYVRRCLSKKQRIKFSLVPIEEVDLQIPEPVEDSFIDAILLGEFEQETKNKNAGPAAGSDEISVFDIKTHFGVTVELVDHVDTFRDKYNELQLLKKKKAAAKAAKKAEAMAEETNKSSTFSLYVFGGLYHGGELISPPIETSYTTYRNNPVWNQKLFTSLRYKDIPRATRLCFTLYMRQMDNDTEVRVKTKDDDAPLGSINIQLFDYKGRLLQGRHKFKLWLGEANPIGTTLENVASQDQPVPEIQLMFEQFSTNAEVVFPEWPHEILPNHKGPTLTVSPSLRRKFTDIAKMDPIEKLSEENRRAVWENRQACACFPELLPRFLQATEWNKRKCVEEAYRMLSVWKAPPGFDALQLLDAKYASPIVREYAVKCIESLTDRECADFLLQLAQVLKYEPYHDSPLAVFLLRRALSNKNQIGHAFFWHLKAEMHNPVIAAKYALLCEAYLRGCGAHRIELAKQNSLLNDLTTVAVKIKGIDNSGERLEVLKSELSKLRLPEGTFGLPLDPRVEVQGLKVEKCKYMDSKKLPLWLVFENAEKRGQDIYVIFKAGDDLRQDVLTLQMIRIMDKLWKQEGLDLRLNAYGCVATGDELGMIEVVLNASTTASINKEAGGSKAVWVKDTIKDWLKKNNGEEDSAGYEKAVENFMHSCAGYCVATYVLGIGDRHNDNIMMTKMGHLFHIDFGHFLGNMKSKYGIKRERAPFIFNPQFAAILGGSHSKLYTEFVKICGTAYNIIRKHGNMFINLFTMMLSTGIPELQSESDLLYLREALAPLMSDDKAAKNFEKLLSIARKTRTVLLNDMIHILAHSK